MTQEKEHGGSSGALSDKLVELHIITSLYFVFYHHITTSLLEGKSIKGLCTYLNTITENRGREGAGGAI